MKMKIVQIDVNFVWLNTMSVLQHYSIVTLGAWCHSLRRPL